MFSEPVQRHYKYRQINPSGLRGQRNGRCRLFLFFTSKSIRESFLDNPSDTLEELGVGTSSREQLDAIANSIKNVLDAQIRGDLMRPITYAESIPNPDPTPDRDPVDPNASVVAAASVLTSPSPNPHLDTMSGPNPTPNPDPTANADPIGPNASVASAVICSSTTGSATSAATYAASEPQRQMSFESTGVEIDFARVRMNEKQVSLEMKIAQLEAMLKFRNRE
jgi:hypothetical protein